MPKFNIRPLQKKDSEWINKVTKKNWGSSKIVSRGKIHRVDLLPGFIAEKDGKNIGLILYNTENNECEIIVLNSFEKGIGIGSSLIESVKEIAKSSNCKRVWVVTTNDNLEAQRFYKNRGFRLVKIYPDAIKESRKLKPEIPFIGKGGIPIEDEIEFEIIL
ncbi:MAG: GNAT family N-acetyltransferase [Patescibacteria group bacterium]|nr:GNAT family N-acetyltransferase [Patescibacteria group bacterium]